MKTTKIIATVGIPGSGKSTLARQMVAKNPNRVVRVNRDDLRVGLFGEDYKFSKKREQQVTAVKEFLIHKYVCDPMVDTIWVDETHCGKTARNQLIRLVDNFNSPKLGSRVNLKWHIIEDSFDVDKCHKRNVERDRTVPFEVIERMFVGFMDFVRDEWYAKHCPEWLPTKEEVWGASEHDLSPCFIVDIDGTLADHTGRRSPFDHNVEVDRPKHDVINLVNSVSKSARIIVFSGREDATKEATIRWLKNNKVTFDELHMRDTVKEKGVKDYVVKMRLWREFVLGKYRVAGVIDDRMQVVRYWRAVGLPTFQVDLGLF